MQETDTAEIIKTYIECFALLVVLALMYLGYNIQKIQTYKSDINYAIERQGGLNATAISSLKSKSEKSYNNFFTIDQAWYDKNQDGKVDYESNEGETGSGSGSWISGTPDNAQYGTGYVYNLSVKIPIPFMSVFHDDNNEGTSIPSTFDVQVKGEGVSKVRSINDK